MCYKSLKHHFLFFFSICESIYKTFTKSASLLTVGLFYIADCPDVLREPEAIYAHQSAVTNQLTSRNNFQTNHQVGRNNQHNQYASINSQPYVDGHRLVVNGPSFYGYQRSRANLPRSSGAFTSAYAYYIH